MKKKQHTSTEKRFSLLIGILGLLAIGILAYGAGTMLAGGHIRDRPVIEETGAEKDNGTTDGAFIKKVSIGDTYGTVTQGSEKDSYLIEAALPADTDITQISCTLELTDGASLAEESNCIINDLGGQLLLNLGVADAQLAVEKDGKTQIYLVELSISES